MRGLQRGVGLGLLWLACGTGLAHADTVTLKDGTVVEGTVVEETAETVVLKLKFGKVTYKREDIKALVKRGAGGAEARDLRDVVKLKSGEEHAGLLVSEDSQQVVIDLVMSGRQVSKTMLVRTTYLRAEVAEIKALSAEQRAAVRGGFEQVEAQAKQDALSEQALKIEPHEWTSRDGKVKLPARKVELDHFTIESDTNDAFLRKAAFRLAKVYQSYAEHFGLDRNAGTKVRVVLFNSMEEYQAAIGGAVKNPAFYAPKLKLISAGCDVAKYEAVIAEVRTYHAELDKKLEDWKRKIDQARASLQAQVSRYFELANQGGKGVTPESKALLDAVQTQKTRLQLQLGEMERQATGIQDEIFALNRRNDLAFQQFTGLMFAMLYHEGFHAFLDNFLFPAELAGQVPLWLNEGLAQYFECARLEGNRFVLGQEDRAKMAILRKWGKSGALIPLADLAVADSKEFLVQDMANLENSTKHYLQAWALTHWLGERSRLQKEILRTYVQALASRKPPLDALPLLTGVSNPELQKGWEEKMKYSFERGAPPAGATGEK